jgi:hypothetical protein
MKEIATIHLELPGAEFPVRAEEEVIPKEPMIFFIERTATYQAEVRHEFFLLPAIYAPPARAGTEFPGNGSESRARGGTIPEAVQAGPKNGPKNAVARRCFRLVDDARSVAFAVLASFSRQPNRIRSIPLHKRECPCWLRTLKAVRFSIRFNSFFQFSPTKKNVNEF